MSEKEALVKKALIINCCLIVYNIIEAIVSILSGMHADSIALVGFGLDSTIEVSSAVILVWRLTHKGTEEEGAEKDKKALFLIGISFFMLAAFVVYQSAGKLIRQEMPDASIVGIIIAALSLAIMPTLGLMKKKIAKQIGSRALEADAMETLICSYLSFALLLGLGLNALLGWWWADPVAGLVMVYFLIKEGKEAISGEECCAKNSALS